MNRLMVFLIMLMGILATLYFLIVNPVNASLDPELRIDVKKDQLERHVSFLCEIDPPRMFENTASLNKCADYVVSHFAELGLPVTRQRYTDGTYDFQNVIAQYKPEARERVVLGAHYDVCGPFQGADDNASGVAGLLEIARLVMFYLPETDYGIDFVAYSTEEPPYFRSNLMGSAVHASSLKDESVDLKLMVVLEMIGYYSDAENSQKYPVAGLKYIYPDKADFIAIVGRTKEFSIVHNFKKQMIHAANISVKSINTPVIFEGIDFSDHRNYWSRDMKAVMITNTSFFRNNHYHSATDTPATLDFDKMTEVVRGTYWALTHL